MTNAIDFATEEAAIWWTSYSRDALSVDTTNFPGDESWKRDAIPPAVRISQGRISFDAPMAWLKPGEPVVFEETEQGLMRADSTNGLYEGVRAETPHAVVLAGNWMYQEYRGVFVAVLPKR